MMIPFPDYGRTASEEDLAPPEPPLTIENREQLIYLLREASELEHVIMCQYLFAAFTMKQSADEGLTPAQVQAVGRWRRVILEVARQEMLHLALVQNLLTSVGAAPHLARPNIPCPARYFPPGVRIELTPFGERSLRHFLFLERPEGMALDDVEGAAAVELSHPLLDDEDIVPSPQDFATVGHLYRAIDVGFAWLTGKLGERKLFVGPPAAQATPSYFGWPELVPVVDLASAHRAVDTIVEQGEGARGDWRQAHFGRFLQVYDEFVALCQEDPSFNPTRAVVTGLVRRQSGGDLPLIGDPGTARVADLFNVANEILLLALTRFFAHTSETDAQLKVLANLSVGLMFSALRPLGQRLTTLPFGPTHPGLTAGPTFEIFYQSGYLLPHREAAWALIEERLRQASEFGRRIDASLGLGIGRVNDSFDRYADELAAG